MTVRRMWIVVAIAVLVGIALFALGPSAGSEVESPRWLVAVGDIMPAVCSLLAMIGFSLATAQLRQWDATKIAWAGFTAAMALCFAAEFGWFVMESVLQRNMDEVYPGFLDGLWIAGYVPLIAGLWTMLIRYRRSGMGLGRPVFYLLLLGVFAAITTLVTRFVLLPIFQDPESSSFYKLVSMAYPAMDLLLLLPALTLTYICTLFSGGIVARPWRYIAIGLVLWTLSDITYTYLDWVGLYRSGHIIDMGWNIGYLFLALGALAQRDLLKSLNSSEGSGHA